MLSMPGKADLPGGKARTAALLTSLDDIRIGLSRIEARAAYDAPWIPFVFVTEDYAASQGA